MTTVTQPPPQPPATTAGESSSDSSTPWGWIAAGVGAAAAVALGLLFWRRRRLSAAKWSAAMDDLTRRGLVTMDEVLAQGSIVTGKVQALAAEAGSLEARAPDDAARAAGAQLRGRLDELAGTLEDDRALRLSSPPPSEQQLSYSTALIRQQVEQLQGVLRPPPPTGPPPA